MNQTFTLSQLLSTQKVWVTTYYLYLSNDFALPPLTSLSSLTILLLYGLKLI